MRMVRCVEQSFKATAGQKGLLQVCVRSCTRTREMENSPERQEYRVSEPIVCEEILVEQHQSDV
jgi:hypothetical protein